LLREIDASGWFGSSADRDQVFVFGKPVYRVHKEIAVTLKSDRAVRREVGIADYHHPRVLLSGILAGGDSQCDRALLVLAGRRILGLTLGFISSLPSCASDASATVLQDRPLPVAFPTFTERARGKIVSMCE
jgi:hypothetical protein